MKTTKIDWTNINRRKLQEQQIEAA